MNVHKIRLGSVNSYIVKCEQGFLLIDAGQPHQIDTFKQECLRRDIPPEEFEFIFITHEHYDHVGSLYEIKGITRAFVITQTLASQTISEGEIVIPAGTNWFFKILSTLGKRFEKNTKYTALMPEMKIPVDMDLHDFGIDAVALLTPGHSRGSISLVFDSGDAFVGDTCFNIYPKYIKSVFPPFADDVPELLKSWEKLLNTDAKMFYPGHGEPFPRELLIKTFERKKKHFS